MPASTKLLQLAADDNVLIVTTALYAGEVLEGPHGEIVVGQDVELGHKVAARLIEQGEKVVRFSMPIGSATGRIAAGEWVHTHNLKSDYIRTYEHRGGDGDA